MGTTSSRNLSVLLNNSEDSTGQSAFYSGMSQSVACSSSDPRSPSAIIYRTPIQMKAVAKTTDCQKGEWSFTHPSAVTDIYRTPVLSNGGALLVDGMSLIHQKPCAGVHCEPKNVADGLMLVDPQSPTVGIERTPIQVQPWKTRGNSIQNVGDHCKSATECAMLLDPRSPTEGIFRTPIQVKAIAVRINPQIVSMGPDGNQMHVESQGVSVYQSSLGNHDTPIMAGKTFKMLTDPRSPSEGIDRTPLALNMNADPHSPSEGIERTPIALNLNASMDSQLTTAVTCCTVIDLNLGASSVIDPRLPSLGIKRTKFTQIPTGIPMALELTSIELDCIRPSALMDCCPVSINSGATSVDPRSPSNGIDRTPITRSLVVASINPSFTNSFLFSTLITSKPSAIVMDPSSAETVFTDGSLTNVNCSPILPHKGLTINLFLF